MADAHRWTAAEYLGFFAYLSVITGGLPDRDVLEAAYAASPARPPEPAPRPQLHVVPPSPPEPAAVEEDGDWRDVA